MRKKENRRRKTRRPMQDITPPRQNASAARVLRSNKEIADSWLERRKVETNDRLPIQDIDKLKALRNEWMYEWLRTELTEQQRAVKRSKNRLFTAYLNNNFAGKNFVMAFWQTGILWAPTPEMLTDDPNGSLEHVAKNFAQWTQKVARAIQRHKRDPDTEEASRRSGFASMKKSLMLPRI